MKYAIKVHQFLQDILEMKKIQKKQLSNQLKSNSINNNVDPNKIRETINKISNGHLTSGIISSLK